MDPEGEFFGSIVDEEVLRAIDALPEEYRTAVVLSDLEGLPYEEIAELMDVPVGTVKSRLFRGRRKLQKVLYDYAVEMGYVPTARRTARMTPTVRGFGSRSEPARRRTRSRPRSHDFLDGELEDVPQEEVRAHFEECQRCYPPPQWRSPSGRLRRAAAGRGGARRSCGDRV